MSHNFEDLKDGLPTQQFEESAQQVLPEVSEPTDLEAEAADIEDHLVRVCRESVREHGDCRPVIAALVGLELQIFHPQWGTEREKAEEFHYINKYLEDQDPSIAVAALPGRYGQKDAPDQAIILLTRTRKGQSMKILPYRVTQHDVTWLDEVVPESFETNVLRVPKVD